MFIFAAFCSKFVHVNEMDDSDDEDPKSIMTQTYKLVTLSYTVKKNMETLIGLKYAINIVQIGGQPE